MSAFKGFHASISVLGWCVCRVGGGERVPWELANIPHFDDLSTHE